jgi:hypothetical protein
VTDELKHPFKLGVRRTKPFFVHVDRGRFFRRGPKPEVCLGQASDSKDTGGPILRLGRRFMRRKSSEYGRIRRWGDLYHVQLHGRVREMHLQVGYQGRGRIWVYINVADL